MTTSGEFERLLTDEELMGFVDGELDEERRAAVVRWLEESQEARDKLAGLELVGELLREHVAAEERADGIADAVMAELEAEPAGEQPNETAAGARRTASEGAEVVRLPLGRPGPAAVDGPRAANDNGRTLFVLAAAAAAVAAGLFFWSRSGADDMALSEHRRGVPPSAVAAATAGATATALEPRWPAAPAEAEPAEEPSAAVEVAAVDFGSHTGTVFYVSTGPEHGATTTAVVWVTDDVTGDGP